MKRRARNAALLPVLALALISGAKSVAAYRPFDGTDAAVANVKETEIELGPLGYRQDGQDRTIIAPAVVYNYGFAEGWEWVLQGQGEHPVSGASRTSSLADDGAFLKGILRPGTLQDQPGPSIATEFGVLLAGVKGETATGVSAAGIVSQRWTALTLHLNASVDVTPDGSADVFLGGIIEGPITWIVRPVAEVFYEHEFGGVESQSVLVGGIWQARKDRTFDVGLRTATVNRLHTFEFRAGVTFGFAS